jgi:perosamine synthetase
MNDTPMNSIPQVQPTLGELEIQEVLEVIRSGWITEGRASEEFKLEFSHLVQAQGVLCPNGTLALWLALLSLGIQPGDEVILPDTTFYGSATAIMGMGACPVPVDVDPEWKMLTPESIEAAITPRTRAIMVVHVYGNACPMDDILEIASSHGLFVIEDAAQGVGVTTKGRHVGSIGDAGTFSFFADKTITMGEGGFVVAREEDVRQRLEYLRNQGRLGRGSFIHPEFGMNFRITDLQAAIGLAQMKRLPDIVSRKKTLWKQYETNFVGHPGVKLLKASPDSDSVPFRAVIEVSDKAKCLDRLKIAGIVPRETFYPIVRQPGYRKWRASAGLPPLDPEYRVSDHHYGHGICLPIHPSMSAQEVDRVCDAVVGT